MKTANILSIDGGGIRGLALLQQLSALEKMLKTPLHKHFDYIAGCSTGGIIGALLSIGYTASDLLELYVDKSENIFHKEFLRFGFFRPKYDDTYFNELIETYTKAKKLSDVETNLIIPAYNLTQKRLRLFKSYKNEDKGITLFNVIRATASAPSFFRPHELAGDKYVDGGLVVNNPAIIAYLEALKEGYERVNILSFSTGDTVKSITDKTSKAGILGWAAPTVDILLSEMTKTTDYELGTIYKNSKSPTGGKIGIYTRCNTLIKKSSDKIDDVSKENIKHLLEDGDSSLTINRNKLMIFSLNTKKNV